MRVASRISLALVAILAGNAPAQFPVPVRPYPPPLPPPVPVSRPVLVTMAPLVAYPLKPGDLERHIERTIKQAFGRQVDDVDVDVDGRRRCVEIDVEICHPALRGPVYQFICSLPELAGWNVRIKIEVD